jgi:hypothetical protein
VLEEWTLGRVRLMNNVRQSLSRLYDKPKLIGHQAVKVINQASVRGMDAGLRPFDE